MSRLDLAHAIKRSAARLVTFAALEPPIEVVLENERRLLLSLLLDFPVNTEAQAAVIARQSIRNDETEHLHKTGFFDAIDAHLKDQPQ